MRSIENHHKTADFGVEPFYNNESSSQVNKRNPTDKRDVFGTQLGNGIMKCDSSLGSIEPRGVGQGRVVRLKKVTVKRIRNLGAIDISDRPRNNQINVSE
jgi:hypothetical protein